MIRPATESDRGQAHTVEAFIAALLLLTGLLFAMQATAVTPLSASTSNQHIENQQRAVASDLLATAAEDGSLAEAVLYWNTTRGGFEDSPPPGYYTDFSSQNEFLSTLNGTFADRRIAYNVEIRYHNTTGTPAFNTDTTQQMVEMGRASDNAVTASRTITLYDTSNLTATDDRSLAAVEDGSGSFYAPDADSSPVYNRLEVRITTWRM